MYERKNLILFFKVVTLKCKCKQLERKSNMMIDRAIEFATKAHEGQFRKGTRRPYIVHPIEVGDIVSTMTTDEEVISAAILHDTIEDCKGVTREVLAENFSERVADKLSNMRDIDRDYPVVGEDLWNRFRMKDKKTIGWYYRGIQEALRERFARVPAYKEYCHLVDRHFGGN